MGPICKVHVSLNIGHAQIDHSFNLFLGLQGHPFSSYLFGESSDSTMDLNSLKEQVSNLTLYDLKAGVRKVQNGKLKEK